MVMITREGEGYCLRTFQDFAQRPEQLFPFFADAANLQAITPAWLGFRILSPLPIAMAKGVEIRYRITLLGIPLDWLTHIDCWQPPYRFVDSQRQGPYRLWVHEHRFEPMREGGTRMIDTVHLRSRGPGALVPMLHYFFVNPRVQAIFAYRRQVLRQQFGASACRSPEIAIDTMNTTTAARDIPS